MGFSPPSPKPKILVTSLHQAVIYLFDLKSLLYFEQPVVESDIEFRLQRQLQQKRGQLNQKGRRISLMNTMEEVI